MGSESQHSIRASVRLRPHLDLRRYFAEKWSINSSKLTPTQSERSRTALNPPGSMSCAKIRQRSMPGLVFGVDSNPLNRRTFSGRANPTSFPLTHSYVKGPDDHLRESIRSSDGKQTHVVDGIEFLFVSSCVFWKHGRNCVKREKNEAHCEHN